MSTKNNVGKFAKGTSGNPTGRPLGSRNRSTLLVEALLCDEAQALTRKLIETALEGDISALRLCIERLAPIRKERSIELKLSPIQNEQQALDSMNTVVTSIGEGRITPHEGESIVNILAAQTKLFMGAELQREQDELDAGYDDEGYPLENEDATEEEEDANEPGQVVPHRTYDD
ncbi:MAG: DUF5681 domain-containing protein [Candidatus Solibacter sp.]